MGCVIVILIGVICFGAIGYLAYYDVKETKKFEDAMDEQDKVFQQERELYLRTQNMELDSEYVIVCSAKEWPEQWKRFNYETIRPHEKFYNIRFSICHDGENHYISVKKEWK